MRSRIEEYSNPHDLKRGAGGIRDIEFTTQIMQLIYGSKHHALRVAPTCTVLRALSQEGLLTEGITEKLILAYRFLRQLEHRCQLVGDVQTHSLPESDLARTNLARTMGFQEWSQLEARLQSVRNQVRDIYDELVSSTPTASNPRDDVLSQLGGRSADVQQWFDPLPMSEAFYTSLKENQGSLDRVRTVLDKAPVLVPRFKSSLVQTEKLVSGEIEEEIDATSRLSRLNPQASTETLAETISSLWLTAATQWAMSPTFDVGLLLTEIFEEGVKQVWKRSGAGFDVVALGSFAQRDLSFGSDTDLLFLVDSSKAHPAAEQAAQRFLSEIDRLKQFGAPLSVDLRLRPEGRKGLLVSTYDGLMNYEAKSMDMWERFALGQPRLVCGSSEAITLMLKCAYARPLTPEAFQDLTAMKKRIETERVRAEDFKRHIKLGYGGLSDIDWLIHLTEMRYPPDRSKGTTADISARVECLGDANRLNQEEVRTIIEARERLMAYRNWIYLLGYEPDIVPGNPDKLEKMAVCVGLPKAADFLQSFLMTIEAVRSIYMHTLERLS
jgi:glutamate-ammonia-ligase adenylyltransferase